MARIRSDLLQAIADKLGTTTTRPAYTRIERAVHDTFLERDLAALVVASKLKININKYSTSAERAAIRGHLRGGGSHTAPALVAAAPAPAVARVRNDNAKKSRKKDNTVFVISGRDGALTESMYALLDALGCKPVEFHQAVSKVRGTGNPFIGDVLDRAFEQNQALVVMFTPDDEAKLKDHFLKKGGDHGERKLSGQPRPNVIFEAGMAMSRHPEKMVMVQVGAVKSFSDISGRHIVHLNGSYDSRLDFATRLGNICKVDTSGTRWTRVGKFTPTVGKRKGK